MLPLRSLSLVLMLLISIVHDVTSFQQPVSVRINKPIPTYHRINDFKFKQTNWQKYTLFTVNPVLSELSTSIFRYGGNVPLVQALAINLLLFVSFREKLLKALTPAGFLHALALGTGLWTTMGWRGWTVCVLYLVLGNFVTKVKFAEKESSGISEGRGGRRGPENVWGSAATGLACAFVASRHQPILGIDPDLFVLSYVASLATKLADTFASEIGKAYGKTTYLITTFKRVAPGTEGAVSAEGTFAAVIGGLLLSLYSYLIGLIGAPYIFVSTLSAFLATNVESILGATLQEKKGFRWMTNEFINFLNTLIGAGLSILLAKLGHIF